MSESSSRRWRPRFPHHATVVAYIALIIALAVPVAAATHLRVRSGDIVNGQVKQADVGRAAVGSGEVVNNSLKGKDVANNSLRGKDVSERSLRVTTIAHRIRGNSTTAAPQRPASNPYALRNNTYVQPAGSSELLFGTITVNFPSGCDPGTGNRDVSVRVFVNGKEVGTGFLSDEGTNSVTRTGPFLTVGGGFVTQRARNRSVTAQVSSDCDQTTSTAVPNVTAVSIDVARFR